MSSAETHSPAAILHVGEVFLDADFASLAEAVKQALPGSRIIVGPGEYPGSLLLDKPLTIVAAELEAGYGCDFSLAAVTSRRYAAVKIAGGELPAITVASDGVLLQGLSLEGGLSVLRGDAWIEECSIRGMAGVAGPHARPTLQSCIFPPSEGVSLYVADRAATELRDCQLGCVFINDGGQATLSACKISGNPAQAGAIVGPGSAATLELCEIMQHAGQGMVISGKATLRGSRVAENGDAGIVVRSGGRLRLDLCDLQRNGGPGIVLEAGQRAFLCRSRIHRNGDAGLKMLAGANCNLVDCHLVENAGAPWHIEPGCHLLEMENFCDRQPPSAPADIEVECPFCLEPFLTASPQACHCPVCGWCFAADEVGRQTTPLSLEVCCANLSCRHIFPAMRSGSDLCPECETGFSWDERGQPIRVTCPACRQDLGFFRPGEYRCDFCGVVSMVDARGTATASHVP